MLKIGGADADGRTVGYYTASVARGRDDYYTGKREAPGQWFGAGAGALGLVGEVDADDFRQVVMDAVDPRTGSVLRQLVGDRPVRGLDLTFSAPKSASLLVFLGGGDVPGNGARGVRGAGGQGRPCRQVGRRGVRRRALSPPHVEGA